MKAQVNFKSTSNQSSKPCTVLQYPSKKVSMPASVSVSTSFCDVTSLTRNMGFGVAATAFVAAHGVPYWCGVPLNPCVLIHDFRQVCVYIWLYLLLQGMHPYVYLCISICIYIYVYTVISIYIYMYIYTYLYIHVYLNL